jgi:adenine-specific DNA-methyltransferase
MTLLERIRQRLEAFGQSRDLTLMTRLFCEDLGWGEPRGFTQRRLQLPSPLSCEVQAVPVAQMSGLPVYCVEWPQERLPGVTARRAVQRALSPLSTEHVVCYLTWDGRQLAFTWARRRSDGKIELRTLPYEVGSPARTTIERLAEMAFSPDELGPTGQPSITAVTDKLNRAFDVEAVTKQFYQELANWFFWASDHVIFPMPKDTPNPDAYKAQSLIRLITRLIFCWFVKQKGLIPADLFDPHRLATLLKNAAHLATSNQSIYYKAILQNLFFATLNQEMDKRAFRKRNKHPGGRDPHHGITNLYRYEDYFTDPRAFLELMRTIPFLNGGLFECLDKVYRTEENRPNERIDGFSDHPKNPLQVPDFLFFGEERVVDLSAAYGEARYRRAKVRGLIHIFNRYNFTVTENTPLDQEVALDPELAGKVFENLLAAYNPETATTARKATGSYYTPRPIVDYMVDEALIAYLKTRLPNPSAQPDLHEQRLRHLLAYNDEPHQFSPEEVEGLIVAIDNLKALDPACGSGAFLMGLLHKLVHILSKLDPHNERWKQRQIAKASEIPDATVREKVIEDIEKAFASGELDYGRKLYLIENCIYGVDIQPIAVQIAKMRFFISLIVDQRVDDAKPNRGILSLPNLETKFVAANTLIGIQKPKQMVLHNPQIDAKEAELRRVRERHFAARTPATKAKCREQDAKLRAEISALLQADGFPRETTEKLARWDPYDQNSSADFFDPEWMFGLRDGFDIVIGNPPYIRQEEIKELKPLLQAQGYTCYTGTADLYVYFYERALQILHDGGVLAFISSNKFFRSDYGQKLRGLLARQTLHRIIDFGDAPVFTAIAYPTIVILSKTPPADPQIRVLNWRPGPPVEQFPEVLRTQSFQLPQHELRPDGWRLESPAVLRLLDKLRAAGKPLGEYVNGRLYYGIKTGLNEAFVVDRATRDRLIAEHESSAEVLKPFLRGRDIKRWRVEPQDLWLLFIPWHFPLHNDRTIVGPSVEAEQAFRKGYPAIYNHLLQFKTELSARNAAETGIRYEWYALQRWGAEYWQEFEQPKIVIPAIERTVSYAPDFQGHYSNDKTTICVSDQINYLLALLNSSALWWFIRATAATKQGGFYEFKPMYVGQLPIPSASRADQAALEAVVDKILAAKRANPLADVSAWEREIDERVYRLYGLTPEEIKIVDESVKR